MYMGRVYLRVGGHKGKVIMGWSLINYIGGPDYFKISGSDRGPDRNILVSKYLVGSN